MRDFTVRSETVPHNGTVFPSAQTGNSTPLSPLCGYRLASPPDAERDFERAMAPEQNKETYTMKEIKNCKCTLATDVYLAHMKGDKDGKPYDFISTRVRDGEGHIHGIAIQPMVWNALGKCSALDTVTFEGTLLVPEETDEGYAESVITRKRTGETYVSGDLVDAKPVSVVKSPFDAENFAKAEDIPVYQKKQATAIQV